MKESSPSLQVVVSNTEEAGKDRPKRLKAKHLTALQRSIIVNEFRASESFEDVAKEMDTPGLTGRTVIEVLLSVIFGRRPSPLGVVSLRQRIAA